MASLEARHLFDVKGLLAAPIDLRDDRSLGRLIVPVVGGSFEGERLRGTVLPIGADWLVSTRHGGRLDVRAVLRTDDGAHISMMYQGINSISAEIRARIMAGEAVDPASYYFRIAPFFEASDERYAWLNGIVAVGYGTRNPDSVEYRVFEIA
jgi:hypothetical protein